MVVVHTNVLIIHVSMVVRYGGRIEYHPIFAIISARPICLNNPVWLCDWQCTGEMREICSNRYLFDLFVGNQQIVDFHMFVDEDIWEGRSAVV